MGGITDIAKGALNVGTLGLFGGGSDSPFDQLFGNNIPGALQNPRLTSFSAPGLDATFASPEQLNLTRSQEVQDSLSGISNAFKTQAGELGGLKPLVEPGFGRLTEAGIRAIRDARRSSIGDLKTNLSRRRVSGSSFGADDISRTNAEFSKRENEFASQAFVQELALSQQLINDQATASASAYSTFLEQANIESNFAVTLSSGVSSILSDNAKIIGDMSNSGSSALLKFGGDIAGLI